MANFRNLLTRFIPFMLLSLMLTGCARQIVRMSDGQSVEFERMIAEVKGARLVFVGETHNVEAESRDPSSILNYYKALLRLRRQSPALLSGQYETLGDDPHVFAYLRRTESQTVLVGLNLSAEKQTIPVDKTALGGRQLKLALSSVRSPGQVLQGNELELAPFEAAVFTTP